MNSIRGTWPGVAVNTIPNSVLDIANVAKNNDTDVWKPSFLRSVKSQKRRQSLSLVNSDLISDIPVMIGNVESSSTRSVQINFKDPDAAKPITTKTIVPNLTKRRNLLLRVVNDTGPIAGASLGCFPKNISGASEVDDLKPNVGIAPKLNSLSTSSKNQSNQDTNILDSLKSLITELKTLEKNVSDFQTQEQNHLQLERIEAVISSIKELKYEILKLHTYKCDSNIDSLISDASRLRNSIAKQLKNKTGTSALIKPVIRQTLAPKLSAAGAEQTKGLLMSSIVLTPLKPLHARKRRSLVALLSSDKSIFKPRFRFESSRGVNKSLNINILNMAPEEKQKTLNRTTRQLGTILSGVTKLINGVKESLDHNVNSLSNMLRPTASITLSEAKRREKIFVDEIMAVLTKAERELEVFRALISDLTPAQEKLTLNKIKQEVEKGISFAIQNYETLMLRNMSVSNV